jgi:hypothetical protein
VKNINRPGKEELKVRKEYATIMADYNKPFIHSFIYEMNE